MTLSLDPAPAVPALRSPALSATGLAPGNAGPRDAAAAVQPAASASPHPPEQPVPAGQQAPALPPAADQRPPSDRLRRSSSVRAPRPSAGAVTHPLPGQPSPEPCPVTDRRVRRAVVRPRLIRELPPEERPRERLAARGPAGLSNAELVALIWGSGAAGHSAVELASEAVATHGGLAGLAGASVVELESLPGVGSARACQLVAAFELGRRLLADWPSGRFTVRTPRDLADRLVLQMGRLDREELRVVLLNTKNQVLAVQTVYQGNVSTALVRVGELFRDAVRQSAAGVILVHNHPSGDPTPSPDDLHLTAEAVAAGRLLDVPVLDHLVIGHDAFVSLRDRGVAFERPGGGR